MHGTSFTTGEGKTKLSSRLATSYSSFREHIRLPSLSEHLLLRSLSPFPRRISELFHLHTSLLNMLIAQSYFAMSKLHYRITYKFLYLSLSLSHTPRFCTSIPDFTTRFPIRSHRVPARTIAPERLSPISTFPRFPFSSAPVIPVTSGNPCA